MTPGRRSLRFEGLDQIMPDVERLLGGYTKVGRWSLGQMCRHLGAFLRASVDLPASTHFDPSLRVDEETKQAVLDRGIPWEDSPTGEAFVPPAGLDDREEVEGLRDALAHYEASPGPAIPHPLFGPLTRAEWDRIHCHHAAHHLSFASPRD